MYHHRMRKTEYRRIASAVRRKAVLMRKGYGEKEAEEKAMWEYGVDNLNPSVL